MMGAKVYIDDQLCGEMAPQDYNRVVFNWTYKNTGMIEVMCSEVLNGSKIKIVHNKQLKVCDVLPYMPPKMPQDWYEGEGIPSANEEL